MLGKIIEAILKGWANTYGSFILTFVLCFIDVLGAFASVLSPIIFLLGLIVKSDLTFVEYCEDIVQLNIIMLQRDPLFMIPIYLGFGYSYLFPKSFLRSSLRAVREVWKTNKVE